MEGGRFLNGNLSTRKDQSQKVDRIHWHCLTQHINLVSLRRSGAYTRVSFGNQWSRSSEDNIAPKSVTDEQLSTLLASIAWSSPKSRFLDYCAFLSCTCRVILNASTGLCMPCERPADLMVSAKQDDRSRYSDVTLDMLGEIERRVQNCR